MADDTQVLTTSRGGINRQRTKGAALKDQLFDLINGYVTEAKTIVVRPGTFREYELADATKGLCSFEEELHVFATESVGAPDGVVVHVITHPDATADAPIDLQAIEFAAPFLGFLYVAATFVNGDTYHYWLQTGDAWEIETVYQAGDIITPTAATGFSYQATRLSAPSVSWAANELREIGEVVEPTVYNGFYYTVVDVQGDNPRSGATEPEWPTEDGAQVIEDADGQATTPASVTEPPSTADVPSPGVVDRYRNLFRGALS